MIKNVQFAVAAAAALCAFQAQAVVVAQWDFESAAFPAAGTSWTGIAPSTGSGTASAVHAGTATWSTPVGNGSARSASANTWAVGDYWQFNFATTGFTGLNLSFDQTSSGTGPRDFTLAYSTNGSIFTNFSSYQVLVNASPAWTSATASPLYTFTVDLSGVSALNNTANVFVRLINNSTVSANGGSVASGGASRIDNFTVNMSPVPEASTTAMLLAGISVLGFLGRRRVQA